MQSRRGADRGRGGKPAGRAAGRGTAADQNAASKETMEKVRQMKARVEHTIRHRIEDQNDRRVAQIKLEHALRDTELTLEEKEAARADYGSQMSSRLRQERARIGVRDFDLVTIIGKGAFGEVRIVKKKGTDDVYAMKTMRKRDMIAKNQGGHVQAERNLMVQADNPFLVKLFFSFQDSTYLYLVMEFCGGGDLMTILMREDILTEEATRFYMAELAAAINAVHELDFVHRDLKPDNILIANNGHIKLSDFGLAKSFNTENDTLLTKYTAKKDTLRDTTAAEDARSAANYRSGKGERGGARGAREKMFSTVGTPDYIAPEVFSQKGYDKMVDWWSMGVIMFECLVGYPPFYAEDPLQTCRKIVHYRKYFRIPKDCSLSPQAVEVIHRLVCSPRRRAGFDWLRSCDFFGALPWDDLEQMEPTYVPDLSSAIDASNFDTIEPDQNDVDDEANTFKPSSAVSSSHFWNYTFARPLNQEDLSNPEEFLRKHGITPEDAGLTPAAAAPATGAPAASRGGRVGGRGGRVGR